MTARPHCPSCRCDPPGDAAPDADAIVAEVRAAIAACDMRRVNAALLEAGRLTERSDRWRVAEAYWPKGAWLMLTSEPP